MKLFPLAKSARLPYEKIKGSVAKRDNFARNMTFDIVDNLKQEFSQGDITLSQLRRALKKTVPKNIDLVVQKNTNNSVYGSLNTLVEENSVLSAYSLDVNLNKRGMVTKSYLPTIGHEMRHLSDYLAFPKVPARECKLERTGLYTQKYFDFYENEVYVDEVFSSQKDKDAILKTLKKKLNKFLKGYKSEEKIDYLQCMRYGLMFEDNAYRTELEIAQNLSKKKSLVNKKGRILTSDDFMFKEKMELLKNMASEIIAQERKKHHSQLKYKNCFNKVLEFFGIK